MPKPSFTSAQLLNRLEPCILFQLSELLLLSLSLSCESCTHVLPLCSYRLVSLVSSRYKQPFSHIPIRFRFSTFVLSFRTPFLMSTFSYSNSHSAISRLTTILISLPLTSFTHSRWLVAQDDTWLQHNLYVNYILFDSMSSPITWDHNVRLYPLNNPFTCSLCQSMAKFIFQSPKHRRWRLSASSRSWHVTFLLPRQLLKPKQNHIFLF